MDELLLPERLELVLLQDELARILERIAVASSVLRVRAEDLARAERHGRPVDVGPLSTLLVRLGRVADELQDAIG